MNFLHLPGWTVTSVKESANDYLVEASCDEGAGFYYCVKCGEMFTKMYRHGSRKQLLMDLPVHGKRVGIELTRKRYRCTKCGVTFLQQLPDVDERSQMTRRLARYIEQQSIHRTFTSVAGDAMATAAARDAVPAAVLADYAQDRDVAGAEELREVFAGE
jgi:transposase